jgi:hypothetical protein
MAFLEVRVSGLVLSKPPVLLATYDCLRVPIAHLVLSQAAPAYYLSDLLWFTFFACVARKRS